MRHKDMNVSDIYSRPVRSKEQNPSEWSPWWSLHILQECIYDSIYLETFLWILLPQIAYKTQEILSHFMFMLGLQYTLPGQETQFTKLGSKWHHFRGLQKSGVCAWAVVVDITAQAPLCKTAYSLQINGVPTLQEPKEWLT